MGNPQELQRWQRILLAIIAAVLVVAGVVTYGLVGQMRAASQSVSYEHAERVIGANAIETAFFERSAGARGYLLSGDPVFLEDRLTASAELARSLQSLRARGGDAPSLDKIEALLERLGAASDRAIAAYATAEEDARALWEREARPVQEHAARQIGELASVERAAFAAARERARGAGQRSATLLAVLLIGAALVVAALFYGYTRATQALLARQEAEQVQTTFRLLDQVPVGIFVLTAQGAPYYANQYAQRLLGRGIVRSSVDRLSETYQFFEAGTDRLYPADRLPIIRALAGDVSECTDMEIRRGDDEVVPLHVVGAPVRDARGELLYAVAGFQDVRELQRLAMRDTLTGLANRGAFTQLYARQSALSARSKRPFAIALIDLDRFKTINDLHGHTGGDEVLKRFATTAVASLRRSDVIARWGGEEFVVLLPDTNATGSARALEKMLANVRELEFLGKDGVKYSATFSAGAVLAASSESLDEVIARADALLYKAKDAGRNRVIVGDAPG